MAEPRPSWPLLISLVDHVAVTDEVDLHQVRAVGNAGGGEHCVDGSADLLECAVDRCRVTKVDLDSAAESGRRLARNPG